MSKSTFFETISSDFNQIKENFKIGITRIGLAFDDDIFSDTLIKCNNKLSESQFDKKQMLSYFWMAFKNNTLRDLGYSRNNNIEDIDDNIIDDNTNDNIDTFDEVTKIIISNFGEELYKLFLLHANGVTYDELYKMTNENNLKYQFRKIREFVRENY